LAQFFFETIPKIPLIEFSLYAMLGVDAFRSFFQNRNLTADAEHAEK
jgi:hypothetical protein